MTLADAILQRKPGNYECPAHQSRSRRTVRYTLTPDGRGLLHDFGGCDTKDILIALGLGWSALFPEPIRDPLQRHKAQRRQQIQENFRQKREAELQKTGERLRERDLLLLEIKAAIQEGAITEEQAWVHLEAAYSVGPYQDYRWNVLWRGTDREVLELFRNEQINR